MDFFAPRARLVVEVDGSQHLGGEHTQHDTARDAKLASLGLQVLRFSSSDVLKAREAVEETIYRTVIERLQEEIPPGPPLTKGGRAETSKKGGMAGKRPLIPARNCQTRNLRGIGMHGSGHEGEWEDQ